MGQGEDIIVPFTAKNIRVGGLAVVEEGRKGGKEKLGHKRKRKIIRKEEEERRER